MNQTVIVLDFGGQYSQLIARKIRECQVYCEVLPWQTPTKAVLEKKPIGLVLSGGPASVYEEGAPTMDPALLGADLPVLGICYGCQLMTKLLGGQVIPAGAETAREYGRTETRFDLSCPVFKGLPEQAITWLNMVQTVVAACGMEDEAAEKRIGEFLPGTTMQFDWDCGVGKFILSRSHPRLSIDMPFSFTSGFIAPASHSVSGPYPVHYRWRAADGPPGCRHPDRCPCHCCPR